MSRVPLISSIILLAFLIACSSHEKAANEKTLTVDIQPFVGFPPDITQQVAEKLKRIFYQVVVEKEVELPSKSFYKSRKRFRADTIIDILSRSALPKQVKIGLTNFDISATKGKIEDWGVMGLGFRPGNTCVVSTFRLDKQTLLTQFYKVCIHELGHTAGLNHCPEKNCFMRDAQGGNPLNEEIEFCNSCKTVLVKKGWNL